MCTTNIQQQARLLGSDIWSLPVAPACLSVLPVGRTFEIIESEESNKFSHYNMKT